jgi:hypothetical protein
VVEGTADFEENDVMVLSRVAMGIVPKERQTATQ